MSAIERIDVPVAGGTIATFRLGEGAAEPVLAIHGITANSRAWLAVLDHFGLDRRGARPGARTRSSVSEEVVRADAGELLEMGRPALRLEVPTELLCAERGMVDDPNPLQPPALAESWAAAAPGLRRTTRVAGVNHYTLVMGATGARAVAKAIVRALQSQAGDPGLRSAG